MEELTTKICVLGGGPAGYTAAIRAAQLGASVVLVEKDAMGGTCLNRGCIPTKALLKSAEVYSLLGQSGEYGVPAKASTRSPDPELLLARKNTIVQQLRAGVELLMKKNAITVCRGIGTVLPGPAVEVKSDGGKTLIHCEKLILAAGSTPLLPPIPGLEQDGVMTSDEAIATAAVPKSIAIIGSGVIGLEFATFYRDMGCEVTIVELLDRILPGEDEAASAALLRAMKKRRIRFLLGARVLRIDRQNGEFSVSYEQNGSAGAVSAERVLAAAGRKLDGLSPDVVELGVQADGHAIRVDARMRTSVENVYAVGDAVGGRLLAHLSSAQGRVAAENAMGLNTALDARAVPACIYTVPEFASVGLNAGAARFLGLDVISGTFDFRANGRSLTLNNRDGLVKIVADRTSHVILGGCILGPEASELISELTLAIQMQTSLEILANLIHPHPSLSEAISEACLDALGIAVHK